MFEIDIETASDIIHIRLSEDGIDMHPNEILLILKYYEELKNED